MSAFSLHDQVAVTTNTNSDKFKNILVMRSTLMKITFKHNFHALWMVISFCKGNDSLMDCGSFCIGLQTINHASDHNEKITCKLNNTQKHIRK